MEHKGIVFVKIMAAIICKWRISTVGVRAAVGATHLACVRVGGTWIVSAYTGAFHTNLIYSN